MIRRAGLFGGTLGVALVASSSWPIVQGALAKDHGVMGQTWAIAEPDLLATIDTRLKTLQANGGINGLLGMIGVEGPNWLRHPTTAMISVIVVQVFKNVGLNMVLFLAGLKAVPRDLYEAAAVDGADGAWERFRRVTWPMLGPAFVFVVTITAIRSFQIFDTVAVLTDGGPNKATSVLLYQMYP